MAESISTLMKESSPSADRLELSAEGACEMTRLTSFFLLHSDSSFFFCRMATGAKGGKDGGGEGGREGGREDYFTDYYFQCPLISFSML